MSRHLARTQCYTNLHTDIDNDDIDEYLERQEDQSPDVEYTNQRAALTVKVIVNVKHNSDDD